MADDWAPGDLALCVSVTHPHWPGQAARIFRRGAIYTVEVVGRPVPQIGGERGLLFREARPRKKRCGFPESCFRKIRPHTPDAEDAETIRLLNGAPVLEPTP